MLNKPVVLVGFKNFFVVFDVLVYLLNVTLRIVLCENVIWLSELLDESVNHVCGVSRDCAHLS